MRFAGIAGRIRLKGAKELASFMHCHNEKMTVRVVGWTSVALAVAALGLYVGHELRSRHKFQQRTQYDFFSHAGDSVPAADYGVGI